MDHWKEPLDLEISDTIIWRSEGDAARGMALIASWDEGEGDHAT